MPVRKQNGKLLCWTDREMGVQETRKKELIMAAIEEIGAHGTLDVTVSQIARRAGVSSSLAFHYFGDKNQAVSGRHAPYPAGLQRRGARGIWPGPRGRARGSTRSCAAIFATSNFERHVISAWLVFYVTALQLPAANQLLQVYKRRLRSTLLFDLRKLSAAPEAIADGLGAMIDGIYIRQALRDDPDPQAALAMAQAYLDRALEG